MHRAAIFALSALALLVLAEGQYYVPRAYYTIDSDGHASPPVALRRLRRSFNPYPLPSSNANAEANANANSWNGGDASATANANANAGAGRGAGGAWSLPSLGIYGATNPNLKH